MALDYRMYGERLVENVCIGLEEMREPPSSPRAITTPAWIRFALVVVFAVTLLCTKGLFASRLAYCCLAGLLVLASFEDLKSRTVPNRYIVIGIGLWVAMIVLQVIQCASYGLAGIGLGVALDNVGSGLIGSVAIAGGTMLLSLVIEKTTGKFTIGGGDIKLLFVVGLFFGVQRGLAMLLIACVFGLFFARMLDERDGFPFAPAISFSTMMLIILM